MRITVIRSLFSVLLSALGIVFLASCSPDAAPNSADSSGAHLSTPAADPARNAPAAERPAAALTGATPAAAVDTTPLAPPKDAQWSLLVYSERGPSHVSEANELKNNLIVKTGRRDWYVIHSADESNIYFGYYRTFDDPRDPTTSRAQADLQMVKKIELIDTTGQPEKPFERAGFVSVAAPDPAAPPAWNLFNKDRDKDPKDPSRAYWSLQIMAFRGNPLRKEAAVQAVAALRKGGVEAYYFHGDTISSVCVGAWPMDAVQQQAGDGTHTSAPSDETPVVFGPGVPVAPIPKTDDQGHPLVAVAPVLNVLDESMKTCMKKYPFNAVNYEIGLKKGVDGKMYQDSSFLVVIPRAAGNGFYDSDPNVAVGPDEVQGHVGLLSPVGPAAPGNNTGAAATDVAPPPPTPGLGHLRRLGDN